MGEPCHRVSADSTIALLNIGTVEPVSHGEEDATGSCVRTLANHDLVTLVEDSEIGLPLIMISHLVVSSLYRRSSAMAKRSRSRDTMEPENLPVEREPWLKTISVKLRLLRPSGPRLELSYVERISLPPVPERRLATAVCPLLLRRSY
jgi:hypothetical protein